MLWNFQTLLHFNTHSAVRTAQFKKESTGVESTRSVHHNYMSQSEVKAQPRTDCLFFHIQLALQSRVKQLHPPSRRRDRCDSKI